MLELQKYLLNKTPARLKEDFGIMFFEHPSLPLVGFKYNQIDSTKYRFEKIVKESRGIVLEKDTWTLVAKGFDRFFNLGENPNEEFDWSDFTISAKIDGSCIFLSHYEGQWLVNTSGSFGLSLCGESGLTWQELFWRTSNLDKERLDPRLTYVFELCTKWNKVVRSYEDSVYLLSCFEKGKELSLEETDNISIDLDLLRPEKINIKSDQIEEFLERKSKEDPTWEGIVCRDRLNRRFKIKTKTYVALHRLKGEGFTTKRILPLILDGEINEVLVYFPEFEEQINKLQDWLDFQLWELYKLWGDSFRIENQKEFALYILPRTKFASLLFNTRKKDSVLLDEWLASADLIFNIYSEEFS